jgi:hypothetical protein
MNRRLLFILLILVLLALSSGAAAAQNSYSLWFIKYWNNEDLEGDHVAGGSTGVIDYVWKGSPAAGVDSNGWSGQWTSIVPFGPGTYKFTTQNDDGVRVYLGDKHIIVDWNVHGTVTNQATVSLLGGDYSMAVDHFDDKDQAVLKLWWERTGPPVAGAADVTIISPKPAPPTPTPPTSGPWLANYWNNTSLAGNSVLARNEAAINYDWGTGSPAHGIVTADHFSTRWTQTVHFNSGTYRFTSQSDDGIRAFIDGNVIIDNWTIHGLQTNTADVFLNTGTYTVVVEYFEYTGLAVAKFGWEKIG